MNKTTIIKIAVLSMTLMTGCKTLKVDYTFLPDTPPTYKINLEPLSNGYAINSLDVTNAKLGYCVTPDGSIQLQSCGTVENLDLELKRNLSDAGGRFYSSMTSFNAEANATVGASGGSTKIYTSTHRIIMEWSRRRYQQLTTIPTTSVGIVSAADVGIAVRVIFDVTISSAEAKARASFGFGDLATALALNQARVMARYDIKGVVGTDLLTNTPPSAITSVSDLLEIQRGYYDRIKLISDLWNSYANGADSLANRFVLSPVAYYISNLPNPNVANNAYYSQGYIFGIKAISEGKSCQIAFQNIPSKDKDFILGFQRAFSDLLRVTSCNDNKPSDEIKSKAAELLQPK
jgi:hypothetical protein